MAGGLTALDISVFSLGGTWLNNLQSTDLNFQAQLANGRTVPMRWQRGVATGMQGRLRASLARGTAPSWKTNLDVSVFTVGGNALVGNLRRGSISITTVTDESKGIADLYNYPAATATDVVIEGELIYNGAGDRPLFALMDDGASALSVTVTITVAGETLAGPFIIESLELTAQTERLQVYRIRLQQEGTLGANGGLTSTPSHSLLASILTGSAVVAYQIKTSATLGAGFDVSGNALITSARVMFEDNQIIRDEFELAMQGTPTIANA